VDQALLQQLPWVEGIRFIDDYEFAVQYQWQAEQIASVLQSILSHFELALNPAKTSIIELPDSFEPLWTSRLRTFVFRDAGIMGQRNDLTAYFDLAFTFHKQDPDGGVLKYAIPRMNGITVEQDNWSLFESILSQCAMVEPATLPQICEQLQHYGAEGYQLNVTDWVSVTNLIVTERLALGQASEAVWAMWLMKQLRLPLSSQAADVIATCEDAFASLMGLGMASVGLADMKRLSSLNRFAEPEELFGKHWLLCYEGAYQGWLVPPSGNGTFSLSSEFNFLSTSGVSFFNINAAPLVPRRRVAGPSESDTSGTGGGGGGGYA
ncbi:MAG TPA: hypothetical protein PLY87_11685, partial [Planctomycetaceae bacterium]|nr:hypothetical protein [Planctomycetaceae bacterium]